MIVFRLYLLAGLVLHKVVWISMKRRARSGGVAVRKVASLHVQIARLLKLAILILIAVQVFLPDVLPILDDPLVLRVLGGTIYSIGMIVAVLGRVQLGGNWSDIEVGRVGEQHQVVSHGVYGYLRHPIYVGDLLVLLGLQLALNSWGVLAVAAMAPPVLVRAIQEERVLHDVLPGYQEYVRRTKRFIPFIV